MKIDPVSKDLLTLDVLIVTPAMEPAWKGRCRMAWERGQVWVVSRQGLVDMKLRRGSGQDRDDIALLEDDT